MGYGMTGQQKSVYLEDEDIRAVEEQARKHDRSFSWALRDLLRRGVKVASIRDNLREMREHEG